MAFSKGVTPWNKGKKGVQQAWNKGMKGYRSGEKHPFYGKKRPEITGTNSTSWKGDNIGKSGLHQRIERILGTPSRCEFCKKTEGKFAWANKSGQYKTSLDDWIRLCYPCHMRYDNVGEKSWKTRRELYG